MQKTRLPSSFLRSRLPSLDAYLKLSCAMVQVGAGCSGRLSVPRATHRWRSIGSGSSNRVQRGQLQVRRSWIQEFHENDTRSVMAYLKERAFQTPPKIKLAFGKLCFKLKSIRCYDSSTRWPELQKLRNLEDFTSRWSNVCDRTSPAVANLLGDLEDWMAEGVVPQSSLSVHLGEKRGMSWDLKYHLEDGEWKLHNAYSRRVVRGTYDVILDNDTSFRIRAVTREKLSGNAADDIQRHITVSIPDDSDFFATTVVMKESAPAGMFIKSFEAKSKVHVEHRSLQFSICYLNQRQSEFRLECRLPKTEKEQLNDEGNACHVLLERVLQLLS